MQSAGPNDSTVHGCMLPCKRPAVPVLDRGARFHHLEFGSHPGNASLRDLGQVYEGRVANAVSDVDGDLRLLRVLDFMKAP